MSASMTRKHFEALAAALRWAEPRNDGGVFSDREHADRVTQWKKDALSVAEVCARFNPNFDRARFLAACGVQEG